MTALSCLIAALIFSGCAEKTLILNESFNDYYIEQQPEESSLYNSSDPENFFSSEEGSVLAPEPEPVSEPEYVEFFRKPSVHSLNLEMSDAEWKDLVYHPMAKTYRSVNLTIDGMRFDNSAIRTRGNSTLYSQAGSTRLPFKIKFDKYIDDRTFFGLDELILLNVADDRAYLRDYLGYEAFRAIDGIAPYVTFFNIYVSGKPHGLYVGVEAVDSSFLERVFNSHRHNLYKSELNATLRPNMELSALTQKKGSDTEKTDLKLLIKTLDEMPLGEKGDIENILDVDSVLKYFAVNAVVHNWDDYAGVFAHNYYLYMNDGVFYFLPWDMNECFLQWQAHYADSPGSQQDIASPITGNVLPRRRPLVQKLLAVEEYYNQYLDYCSQLNDWLKEIDGSGRLDEFWEILGVHIKNDPTRMYKYSRIQSEYNRNYHYGIAGYIRERTIYLTKRLEQLRPVNNNSGQVNSGQE